MSGPVEEAHGVDLGISAIEVKEGRTTRLGGTGIVRVLPTKRRRAIGPWCFVDLMQPDDVTDPPPLEIGPHPHIGLATVTWLFGGEVLHSDSLGSEQLIRPGQLNLMTSGHGIAHAEHGVSARPPEGTGGMLGAQMWLAQTDQSRHGTSAFQHVPALPEVSLPGASGRLLIGALAGEASPARVDHPTVGLDLILHGSATVPADPTFEYGVVPIDRPIRVEDAIVEPGALAVVPPGYDALRLDARDLGGRVLLLGGEPLGVELTMWWNFVARSKDEITEAWRAWQDHDGDRFAPVPSSLRRIDAPTPPWVRQD